MPSIQKVTQTPKPTPRKQIQTSNVLDRIQDIELDEGLKVAIYGQSGSGKTTFWATFPKPILAIICSGGLKPGELRSVATAENKGKIKQVVLQEVQELATVVDHARTTGKYNTIVLDHCTGFADLTLKEILELDSIPIQKTFGMAKQQDYGQSAIMCKEAFRSLLDLSCNVVFVAQERDFKIEGVSEEIITPTIGPALSPSVAGWLNPACDYVVQTFKRPKMREVKSVIAGKEHVTYERDKGVEYALRTAAHDIYITKFRVPKGHKVPEVIVDPTYDKLMKVIMGA